MSVLPTSNRLPHEEPRCQELDAIGSDGLAVGKNWDAPLLQPDLVHPRKVRLNDGQVSSQGTKKNLQSPHTCLGDEAFYADWD